MSPLNRLRSELEVYLASAKQPLAQARVLLTEVNQTLNALENFSVKETFGFPVLQALPQVRESFLRASYYCAQEITRDTYPSPNPTQLVSKAKTKTNT